MWECTFLRKHTCCALPKEYGAIIRTYVIIYSKQQSFATSFSFVRKLTSRCRFQHSCLVFFFGISDAMSDVLGAHLPGLLCELGGRDGALTFEQAIMHTTGQGLKLEGPETRPLTSIRDAGGVNVDDEPLRFLDSISGKVERFRDAIQHAKIDVTRGFFESKLVKEWMTCTYKGLPEAFRPGQKPQVSYTMQLIIIPATRRRLGLTAKSRLFFRGRNSSTCHSFQRLQQPHLERPYPEAPSTTCPGLDCSCQVKEIKRWVVPRIDPEAFGVLCGSHFQNISL